MSNQISCTEVRQLLFELHRGECSNLKRAEVDEHLRHCRPCRQLVSRTDDIFEAAKEGADVYADIDEEQLFERVQTLIEESSPTDDSNNSDHSDDFGQQVRLDEMFDAARDTDDNSWATFDSDELFERIEQETTAQQDEPSNTDARAVEPPDCDGEEIEPHTDDKRPPPRRRRLAAIAACAASLALIGWWGWSIDFGSAPNSDNEARIDTTASDVEEPDETAGAIAADSTRMSLPSLQSLQSEGETLRLFGSEDVQYDVVQEDQTSSVELAGGSMLVEYLPQPDDRLSVRALDHTITAVGTVFSVAVDSDNVEVGVFDGAVRIDYPNGASRRLETGQFIVGDDTGTIDEATHIEVERHINLDAHRRTLQQRSKSDARQAANHLSVASRAQQTARQISEAEQAPSEPSEEQIPPEEPPGTEESAAPATAETDDLDEPSDEAVPQSPHQLHEMALQALRDREHRRAADLLSRALHKTEPTDRAHADILLELARIHLHNLDEPQRAADYLSRFVDHWPDDPAANAIERQLCEMDSVDSAENKLCD